MGVRNLQEFYKRIEQIKAIIQHEIIKTLAYVGEDTTTFAREREALDSWFDRTGNLRSSIGYMVLHEGKEVMRFEFPRVSTGQELTAEDVQQYESNMEATFNKAMQEAGMGGNYNLVLIAGMEYAGHVESLPDKDVLVTPYAKAVDELLEMSKPLNRKIDKAIKRELR